MTIFDSSRFLELLQRGEDVVVKRDPALPLVGRGSDVDIFTVRPHELLREFESEVLAEEALSARVSRLNNSHFQFDIYDDRGFLLKFDLFSAFPRYERFSVQQYLFYRLISEAQELTANNHARFPVLAPVHEGLIRYFEYVEYFWTGPEKPKHFDWIVTQLTAIEQSRLYELAHKVVKPRNWGNEYPPNLSRQGGLFRNGWLSRLVDTIEFRFPPAVLLRKLVGKIRRFKTDGV